MYYDIQTYYNTLPWCDLQHLDINVSPGYHLEHSWSLPYIRWILLRVCSETDPWRAKLNVRYDKGADGRTTVKLPECCIQDMLEWQAHTITNKHARTHARRHTHSYTHSTWCAANCVVCCEVNERSSNAPSASPHNPHHVCSCDQSYLGSNEQMTWTFCIFFLYTYY